MKYKLIALLLALSIDTASASVFATDCPPPGRAPAKSGYTLEQQAKDQQQQAKDAQQAAKDKQQADTDARQVAFGHMLDRREFLYNSQKPDPNYKCPQPCCNGQVKKEEVKVECPPTPAPTPTQGYVCWKKDGVNGWCKKQDGKEYTTNYKGTFVDGIPQDEHLKMEKEAKKKFPNEPFQAANELTKLKDDYKVKHTNRSGHMDGTNPGGQDHNPNGYDNPSQASN